MSGLSPHQKLCIKRKRNLEEDLALLGKLQNVNPSEPRLEAAAVPSGLHAAPCVFQGVENTWVSEIPVDNIIDVPDNNVDSLDDIRIEYHPHTGLPAETFAFSDFSRTHFPVPPAPDPDRDPWSPFWTLLDFEIVELALEAVLNKDQTERLIRLLQWLHNQREKFTIRNHADLRATWDASGACLTPDPAIGPHCIFDAQQLLKFDGNSFVRFVDEPYTANAFWDLQTDLPKEGRVLGFILYVDKSKLSSFSREKGYPIVARLANLPTAI
ncbi:hypothetical protein OG21DRAFT_1488704 [Imleria badia]|nr:hypothetical protein OG21DRAFT_1488704 [Imleria badia]